LLLVSISLPLAWCKLGFFGKQFNYSQVRVTVYFAYPLSDLSWELYHTPMCVPWWETMSFNLRYQVCPFLVFTFSSCRTRHPVRRSPSDVLWWKFQGVARDRVWDRNNCDQRCMSVQWTGIRHNFRVLPDFFRSIMLPPSASSYSLSLLRTVSLWVISTCISVVCFLSFHIFRYRSYWQPRSAQVLTQWLWGLRMQNSFRTSCLAFYKTLISFRGPKSRLAYQSRQNLICVKSIKRGGYKTIGAKTPLILMKNRSALTVG